MSRMRGALINYMRCIDIWQLHHKQITNTNGKFDEWSSLKIKSPLNWLFATLYLLENNSSKYTRSRCHASVLFELRLRYCHIDISIRPSWSCGLQVKVECYFNQSPIVQTRCRAADCDAIGLWLDLDLLHSYCPTMQLSAQNVCNGRGMRKTKMGQLAE